MYFVKKQGIQILLRKPEQKEPHGKPWWIIELSVFERNGMGGFYHFVSLMIRVSGGFFYTSYSATKYTNIFVGILIQ
jgi:hypothetical protein